MKQKLYYIANIRFPTEKAHGIHIAKMCEAFASLGYDVELIVTTRKTPITADPYEYYGIKKNFRIKHLPCFDIVRFGRLGFLMESLSFIGSVGAYLLLKRGLFYTRDEIVAFFLKIAGKNPVWEAHMGHKNIFARFLLKSRTHLVVITQGLRDLYKRLGWPASLIHVAPDAVDMRQFDLTLSKIDARRKLNFPKDDKIVLYTGHLYSWKGADILAEAAVHLEGSEVYFVGGTDVDVLAFKEKFGSISNVHILGRKPHQDIPIYLKAADILVIPNSAKEDISKLYTSPMKLFEYMASGTPIIASNLDSIREILDESTAQFFTADDVQSLSKSIAYTFTNYRAALDKSKRAIDEVRKYSWENRAKNIIQFISR